MPCLIYAICSKDYFILLHQSQYLGLNSGRSVSVNVNKTRNHFSSTIRGARMFPLCFLVSHAGNIVSSVGFCFEDANCAYAARQRILTKIRACEHLQKLLRARASEHLSNFASNSSNGESLRALSNWMGPFDTPYHDSGSSCNGTVASIGLAVPKLSCLHGQPQYSLFLKGCNSPRSIYQYSDMALRANFYIWCCFLCLK